MPGATLIAIGGNALITPRGPTTLAAQRGHLADACDAIAQVVAAGARVVITHGNGPQVGAALLRSERAALETYPLPLDLCVASTQGEIGLLLQQGLTDRFLAYGIHRQIVTLITQVVVDPRDEAFTSPTKPIGPFYTSDDADARRRLGWTVVEERSHGWRRVVPSPAPLEIVEEQAIRTLMNADAIVIALGGGGVPVAREGGRLKGVEAVIDKDLGSALLATRLGCERLVLATDVDGAYLDFGSGRDRLLERVTTAELRHHAAAGHFGPGTMAPKVEAAIRFVDAGGRQAVVTASHRIPESLRGLAGTHVVAPTSANPTREELLFGRAVS